MAFYRNLIVTSTLFLFVGCGTLKVSDTNSSTSTITDSSNTTLVLVQNPTPTPTIEIPSPTPPKVEDLNSSNSDENIVSDKNSSTSINLNEHIIIDSSSSTQSDYKSRYINSKTCNQIINKEFFEICYDYKFKAAKAVFYTLEGDLVNELNIEERPDFYEEETIDEQYRAKYSDYTNSGYDRGHLAPDASFDWSEESLNATYSLANIIPQVPKVNREIWSKVEKYARDKAVKLGEVNVLNLVKYGSNPKFIGEDKIAVSIGFYKILYNKSLNYNECFYYLNSKAESDDNVSSHKVNCSEI